MHCFCVFFVILSPFLNINSFSASPPIYSQYKKSLQAAATTSQPVISDEDIQVIFSNIEVVNTIHEEFVGALEPKVKNWSHSERIGEIFKILVSLCHLQ